MDIFFDLRKEEPVIHEKELHKPLLRRLTVLGVRFVHVGGSGMFAFSSSLPAACYDQCMDANNPYVRLMEIGYKLASPVVRREDGVCLVRINDMALYEGDAMRVADGSATLSTIRAEYEGQRIPPSPYDQSRYK
jgi:hypothetical protein